MTPRQVAELLQAAHREARASAPGAGELAIAQTVDLDLATVTPTAPLPWRGRGYGLIFPADGNPAGARLRVDFQGGGNFTTVAPGSRILAPFDRFDVYRAADSDTVGTARLYVLTRPDAELELGVAQPVERTSQVVCSPAGGGTQTQNSAAGNVPTAATDGFSLVGVEAARLKVEVIGVDTLGLPGLIRWWFFDGAWRWSEDYLAPTLPAATEEAWVSADVLILLRGAGAQRVYPEVVSWPTTGGADFVVTAWLSGRV